MMNGVLTKYYCDSNGNVSNSGTLATTGSYGAWAHAPLNETSYGTGSPLMTWGALTTSTNITDTTSSDSFQVSQAGTYAISCFVNASASGSSSVMQLIARYSTIGSTWSTALVSTYPGSSIPSRKITLSIHGIYTMAANSYIDMQIYNATGATITLVATAPNSYFQMYRIGRLR